MFKRFYTHPLALGSAIAVTFMLLLGLSHLGGNDGAYHVLARTSDHVAQQVDIVGQRLIQQVVITGRKAKD